MSAVEERRLWGTAGAIALAAHAVVAGLVLALARPHEAVPPEPVMLVELPPLAAPAPRAVAAEQPQPQAQPRASTLPAPPVAVPVVRAPLPANPVTLPPPAPEPVRVAPAPAPVAAPAPASAPATSAAPGDPRARKAELDYFSLVSAHLNRHKSYPPEAKRAREEGVVTVRFTIDRDGNVSGAAIRRSSGHDLLDAATLDLLRRVAPLPKMPPTMLRDSVTISLPIEYALKTS
jgi:protein TonB